MMQDKPVITKGAFDSQNLAFYDTAKGEYRVYLRVFREGGRDVDTAPRWFGSVELQYLPSDSLSFGLQWTAIGQYYLDAENRFRYPGHSVANLRAGIRLSSTLHLVLRLNNVTDRDIADRADYAFGNYRYFPGRGRELFAELRYTP